ncbi:unnamed protein product [Brassicogethes aeneus]|uniref:Uncharacterized protein n=1 Tax=Brassicogethes aeneus TaxID=1431903 RepID=A0A9P0BE83_BRAAE|nr:unnamed protein product [Brassicogethes aeneus]
MIELVNTFSRKALHDILIEFKGKKLDDKFSLMEEKLVKITKCPDNKKSVISRESYEDTEEEKTDEEKEEAGEEEDEDDEEEMNSSSD